MNRKYLVYCAFGLLVLGGCQIHLLPELTPARKMVPNFEVVPFERVCEAEAKTIYLSGMIIPEPFHGRKIMFELENGEVEEVHSIEWAGQFEQLFKHSFEHGLRKAFALYPEVVFLSEESSAETELEFGMKVVSIKKSARIDRKVLLQIEMVTRVSDLKSGQDNYQAWIKSFETPAETDSELVYGLRTLVSKISKEIYVVLQHKVCSSSSHQEVDISVDPS